MKSWGILAIVAVLVACSASVESTDRQVIPTNQLLRYRTFAFAPQNVPVRFGNTINAFPGLNDRIRNEILEGFRSASLRSDNESPELYVYYYFGVENLDHIGPFPYTIGARSEKFLSGIGFGIIGSQKFIIDLVDSRNNELVWRGIDSLSSVPTERTISKEIPAIIERMTRKFPG